MCLSICFFGQGSYQQDFIESWNKDWSKLCQNKNVNEENLQILLQDFEKCYSEYNNMKLKYYTDQDDCSLESDYTNDLVKDPVLKTLLDWNCSPSYSQCRYNSTRNSRTETGRAENYRKLKERNENLNVIL